MVPMNARDQTAEIEERIAADLTELLSEDRGDLVVLNDAPPLFARRIVTEGRRLVCQDFETDHAFVRNVQLRAADLKPFIDRMRKIKLESLSPR